MDSISASEGTLAEAQGDVLISGFASLQPAITAARRLQWAMQGLAETDAHVGAAALVQSAAEAAQPNAHQAIQQATAGQILLSERASHLCENLPGLHLHQSTGMALRELLWRAPDEQTTPDFDEQMLASLLESQGLAYQPPVPPPPVPIKGVSGTKSFRKPSLPADSDSAPSTNKWLLIGIAAAAVILLVVLVPRLFRSSSPTPAVSVPTSIVTPSESESAAPSNVSTKPAAQPEHLTKREKQQQAAAAAAAAAAAKKNPAEAAKNAPVAKNPTPAPAPAQPAPKPVEIPLTSRANCTIDASEYAGYLASADQQLARGQYDRAESKYSTVLKCDPGNARAREGLERVHRSRDAQN